jgi:hypothetical protein
MRRKAIGVAISTVSLLATTSALLSKIPRPGSSAIQTDIITAA